MKCQRCGAEIQGSGRKYCGNKYLKFGCQYEVKKGKYVRAVPVPKGKSYFDYLAQDLQKQGKGQLEITHTVNRIKNIQSKGNTWGWDMRGRL